MTPTPSIRSTFSFAEALQSVSGNLVNDGESGLRVNGFMPAASPLRRSVAEYYPTSTGYCNAPVRPLSTELPSRPPSYYNFGDSSLPPTRFKIYPREEEGKESLPGYSCTISKDAVFYMKLELSSPFERARDRAWKKVYVALKGTALFIHKPKRKPFFGGAEYHISGEPSLDYLPGKILRCYTLQGAEVGIAADYKKRHYVIRLRAEVHQMIFTLPSLEDLLLWTEAIGAAIDLSPSLDERSLPRYQTIPRRRRRRNPEQILSEQADIIRREFPHLAADSGLSRATTNATAATVLPTIQEGSALAIQETQSERERRLSIQESITSGSYRSAARAQAAIMPPDPEDCRKPSLVQVSEETNQRYAKKCMAVLCSDAPRQSDWVICNGKRWKLLWEKKVMVEDNGDEEGLGDPPSYDVIVRT